MVGEDGDDYGLFQDAFLFEEFEGALGLGVLLSEPGSEDGFDPWGQEGRPGEDDHPEGYDRPSISVDPTAQAIERGSVDIAGQDVTSGKPSLPRL